MPRERRSKVSKCRIAGLHLSETPGVCNTHTQGHDSSRSVPELMCHPFEFKVPRCAHRLTFRTTYSGCIYLTVSAVSYPCQDRHQKSRFARASSTLRKQLSPVSKPPRFFRKILLAFSMSLSSPRARIWDISEKGEKKK